ncbi:lysozyme-like [Chrysoperla carnea]|uniref:lysozyme-like n=1 Tax=Chrysoperla carnea TaxID=189513 RepID=UPI001D088FA2|nr:lysozyme-like [Chrysoperla carnea]
MKLFHCLLLICVTFVSGRILDECEVAQELLDQGFDRGELPDWVCLVESESSGDTSVVGGPNTDGSSDYGLFQINDAFWCTPGGAGGECNVACEDLLDDDISDDVQCARKIESAQGLDAWVGWQNKCSGGRAPNVDKCF